MTHVEDQLQILMFYRDVLHEKRMICNFYSGLDQRYKIFMIKWIKPPCISRNRKNDKDHKMRCHTPRASVPAPGQKHH